MFIQFFNQKMSLVRPSYVQDIVPLNFLKVIPLKVYLHHNTLHVPNYIDHQVFKIVVDGNK
jgi:hypothetical protein